MNNIIFNSMAFSICALIFLVLILITYISKKKFKKTENHVYAFMLWLTVLLLIIEISAVFTMSIRNKIPIINEILCRGYILFSIIWVISFTFYVLSLSDKRAETLKRKSTIITIIISIILTIILFVASCFLDITYIGGNGDLYVIGGPTVYTIYVAGFILTFVLLIKLIKNNINIPKSQRFPIYFVIVFFAVITLAQIISGYDFNDLTYFFAFSISTLYFTIESQDNKLKGDLEIAKDEAEMADKAKTEFLSNMSHEIRTPLNTILGFSNSLLSEKKLTEDMVKKDTKNIHDASVILLSLINNILDISRIESGKETVDEKDYRLDNILFDINSFVYSKTSKEVEFSVNVNEDIPSKYYGDPVKLYKIITLIITNSIKYTKYGQIKLDINGAVKENNYFEFNIVVSNTGHAMKIDDFEKDFNDFVKLGNSKQNNIDSTTLGLIVAKRLIDMLGGTIKFINETGKGTKYIVTLDQKIVDNQKIGNIYEASKEAKDVLKSIDCSGKVALIVDDNILNIKLATRLLGTYKFKVESCLNGKDCLEKVKEKKYDVIFLDHMMPEMDGITTLKLLKQSGYNIPPVIALTANSYSGIRDKYIKDGFYDFLAKPIVVKDLNKLIYNLFGNKE